MKSPTKRPARKTRRTMMKATKMTARTLTPRRKVCKRGVCCLRVAARGCTVSVRKYMNYLLTEQGRLISVFLYAFLLLFLIEQFNQFLCCYVYFVPFAPAKTTTKSKLPVRIRKCASKDLQEHAGNGIKIVTFGFPPSKGAGVVRLD